MPDFNVDRSATSLADLMATNHEGSRRQIANTETIALIHDHNVGDEDMPEIINGATSKPCAQDRSLSNL